MDKPAADIVQDRRAATAATLSGVAALVTAFGSLPAALGAAMQGWGAAGSLVRWSCVGLLCGLAVFFGLRALKRRSRLLRPEAFRIDPADRRLLKGREDEVEELVDLLQTRPLVFIEGESGSGKTALLQAGLASALAAEGTVALYVDLAGVGWADHLEQVLRQHVRDSLPENRKGLAARGRPLQAVLDALSSPTKKPACLLFDQLDDYQTEHAAQFHTAGVWKSASEIEAVNPVWARLAQGVRKQELRLVFATRTDMAAGLACMRFVDDKTLRLTRISQGLIAPVLEEITRPEAGGTPVVERPEAGWSRLKERLLRDLAVNDRILPIQLVVVLEALRRLKALTIQAYDAVGGEPGLERLHIERNAADAADAAGCPPGQVIDLLVQMCDAQGQKTEARTQAQLEAAPRLDGRHALSPDALLRALESLEQRRIVRRRQGSDDATVVWLLRHDFLARGVVAAQRHAGRWRILLEDRQRALDEATGPAGWWSALLPPRALLRLAWERLRGRVAFSAQRRLAWLSLVRLLPAVALAALCAGAVVQWRHAQDEALAGEIFNAIGQQPTAYTPHELVELDKLAHASDRVREAVVRRAFDGPDYDAALNRIDVLLNIWWRLDPDGRRRRKTFEGVIPEYMDGYGRDVALYALVESAWAQAPAARPGQAVVVQRVLARAMTEKDPSRLGREIGILAFAGTALGDAPCRALLEHVGQVAVDAQGTLRSALASRVGWLLVDRPALANELFAGVSVTRDVALFWSEVLAWMPQVVQSVPLISPAGGPSATQRIVALCGAARGRLAEQLRASISEAAYPLGALPWWPGGPEATAACRVPPDALAGADRPSVQSLRKTLDEAGSEPQRIAAATALAARAGELDAASAGAILARLRRILQDANPEQDETALAAASMAVAIGADRAHAGLYLDDVLDALKYRSSLRPGGDMLAALRAAPQARRAQIVRNVLAEMPSLAQYDRWSAASVVEAFTTPEESGPRLQAARSLVEHPDPADGFYGAVALQMATWGRLTEGLSAPECQSLAKAILRPAPSRQDPVYPSYVVGEGDASLALLLPLAGRLDDSQVHEATDRLYRGARQSQPEDGMFLAGSPLRNVDAVVFLRWAGALGSRYDQPGRLLDVLALAGTSIPQLTLAEDPLGSMDLLGAYRMNGALAQAPVEAAVARQLRAAPLDALVDILKLPYAVGTTRRIVLDAIGQQAGVDFGGDLWRFVAWARSPAAARWKLDLDAPPVQRPAAVA